jgi:hypothetical protein
MRNAMTLGLKPSAAQKNNFAIEAIRISLI